MADVSDVQDALVLAVDGLRTRCGGQWIIARGFPPASVLDASMAARQVLVTVFQREGYTRLTTRFPSTERPLPAAAPTLTVMVAGIVATFGGVCGLDQVAGVKSALGEFTTRCLLGDTPSTIAARLATAAGGTASGPSLTVPALLTARVVRDVPTLRATRQQDVGICITVWAADPVQRDDVSRIIDAGLSDDDMRFLPLRDLSQTWVRSAGSRQTDRAEAADIYRNDIYLTCEFSTTIAAVRPVVLFPDVVIKGGV